MARTHCRRRIASGMSDSVRAGNLLATLLLVSCCLGLTGCNRKADSLKTLHFAIRSDGPKGMDPVRVSTQYDHVATAQVYDTLLQYKYLARPLDLEPSLLAEMPTIGEDGVTWSFRLKKGVHFCDDECFPAGKGREVVTRDVFYSWKRMADLGNTPKGWWLFKATIAGFDEYRDAQNAAETFNYDAPVEGFREISDHEFQIVLTEPVTRFRWILAMPQTAIVAREAVEKYGREFPHHPVGTGPWIVEDWQPSRHLRLQRNPGYRAEVYPDEASPQDVELGLTRAAGQRLPIADRLEYRMFVQDQPMWLNFLAKRIDYSQVPAEYFNEAYIKRTQRLRASYRDEGITSQPIVLFDFIFTGFNMTDSVVGGYTPEKRALRRAISMALDIEERNDTFYNGINVVYDGMIPPGLAGHPPDGVAPNSPRGPNLERARELLVEAGYPNGEGLQELEYYSGRGSNYPEQAEMMQRQLSRLGIRLKVRLVDFSTLMEIVDNRKAQLFSFAWGSDYPDAENNLALFYGPNRPPSSNHFCYENPQYDRLYEMILTMPPSEERTKIYEQMRDIVLNDMPYVGSMARTRFYIAHKRLKNFKPSETFQNWTKYLDIEEE
ncbi:MAG: ABC transporter substrate-binding protein [Planctomycetota bacterium]|nr:ABC transporter substrate-binding protein [Planctomycetota bacterium]